jgi:hypothetical protein
VVHPEKSDAGSNPVASAKSLNNTKHEVIPIASLEAVDNVLNYEENTKTPRDELNEAEKDLTTKYPELKIDRSGNGMPFQAYGTYKGYDLYFRFRSDTARLDIGRKTEKDGIPSEPYWQSSKYPVTGEPYPGCLNADEYYELFSELMDEIKNDVIPLTAVQELKIWFRNSFKYVQRTLKRLEELSKNYPEEQRKSIINDDFLQIKTDALNTAWDGWKHIIEGDESHATPTSEQIIKQYGTSSKERQYCLFIDKAYELTKDPNEPDYDEKFFELFDIKQKKPIQHPWEDLMFYAEYVLYSDEKYKQK